MYTRGSLPKQIEFDPARPFSIASGYGDLYRGKLHLKSYPDGTPSQYSHVALKRFPRGIDDGEDLRLENSIKETSVWSRLYHPNILRFLGMLFDNDEIYLISPFAPHGSLPQYIVAHPDADRRMFVWQVAGGLWHLHLQEIIHGDLKGANLLLFDGPTVKISDFGLSKIADGRHTTSPQYSLPWTSPERLLGAPRSYASDVYTFGITIYEILSGKVPFRQFDSFVRFFKAICEEGVRPPMHPKFCCAGISYVALWMTAGQCWQKVPENRPSMKEVCDLVAVLEADAPTYGDLDDLPVQYISPLSHANLYRMERANDRDTDNLPAFSIPVLSSSTNAEQTERLVGTNGPDALDNASRQTEQSSLPTSAIPYAYISLDILIHLLINVVDHSTYLPRTAPPEGVFREVAGVGSNLQDTQRRNMIERLRLFVESQPIMARRFRVYTRDQIQFNPSQAFSTAGSYGDVFRGTHSEEGILALKRLRWGTEDQTDTFVSAMKEACVWQGLHHQNILRFLGLLCTTDDIYLISPFATHGSLPKYLRERPDADRTEFIRQIAAGLAFLHAQGIIHGDVKGGNILVSQGHFAQLCDFGLAKFANAITSKSNGGVGSLRWLSPERADGGTRTKASDVYAFGMTIYQILSGHIPFHDLKENTKVMIAIVVRDERPLAPVALLTAESSHMQLWPVAERCWSKQPEDRPTMEETCKLILRP